MIYKIIPLLPIGALMAFIVQFNSQHWFHGFGIAQKKINVLAVNAIGIGTVLSEVTGLGIKQIAE